jgi:hypothetical protein
VAASLADLPVAGRGRVLELERELPSGADGDALTVRRAWDPAELGELLAERFRSLARRSSDAAAFEAVLAAWSVPR